MEMKTLVVNGVLSMILLTVFCSYYVDYKKLKSLEWKTTALSDQMTILMKFLYNSNNSDHKNLKVDPNMEKITTEMTNFQIKMKDEVQNTINNMKAYEKVDRTGRTDFALENSGGSIFDYNATLLSSMFNILKWQTPRKLIQSNMQPGECFAFVGDQASVTIKLLGSVFVDSVTVEHIPCEISPLGNINSAPKEFLVCGHKFPEDEQHIHLGKFSYKINVRELVQTFHFPKKSLTSMQYVKIHFLSNHGSMNTCVYRIRIHGILDKKIELDTIA